jgi:hypothetical protein
VRGRWFTVVAPAALALLTACAPHLAPLGSDALSVTQVWKGNRDRYPAVSALADVTVDAGADPLAWPEFTAVFAYHAPDRVAVTGFTPLGQLLFTYEAGDGRYILRGPDTDTVRTGRLGAKGGSAETRLLGALAHLVDGVLGPDTGDAQVGVAPDGRWVVRARGETVYLGLEDGQVDEVEVRRRGGAAVALVFDDWRDAGPLQAPYRIVVTAAASGPSAEIRVQEWHVEGASDTAAEPAPALTATRFSPYFDVPRPEPRDVSDHGPDRRPPRLPEAAGALRSSGADSGG